MLGLPFSGLLKAPHGKSRDVQGALCVDAQLCKGRCQPSQNTRGRCHLPWVPAFQLWGEKREMLPCGCCFLSIRDSQAASRLPASPEGIIPIHTDSIPRPCSRDCCQVGCGWHWSICLASSWSVTAAGTKLPQSRHRHSGVRRRCQSAHNFCSLYFKTDETNK